MVIVTSYIKKGRQVNVFYY